MRLIVDIGNTFSKFAVFKGRKILITQTKEHFTVADIRELLNKYDQIKASIVSSVSDYDQNIDEELRSKTHFVLLGHNTKLPFINLYKTPTTLGNDRIAAVAGAMEMFPGKNVLVIDAGTCITYELLTDKGEYLGGAISPRIKMRYKSLNTFTKNLPLIQPKPDQKIELIGNTTGSSILSGVQNTVLMEVNSMINEYKHRFTDLKIILTGGDHKYFDRMLKSNIFAAPNLVLKGLNKILDFNESN